MSAIEQINVNGALYDVQDAGAVRAEAGKGLSTEDYTTAEKNKLAGIEAGAQANVNADWQASGNDAEILHKPTTIAGYGITDAYTKAETDAALDDKQDALSFDATPTAGSTNPVTSGGVFTALSGKADAAAVYTKAEVDTLLADKQDTLTFDQTPTAGSTNPVTSEGIRAAIYDDPASVVYGFHIDSTEGDPAACVTYLRDAIGLTPAYMDFAANVFRWGGWADAFFLPRPCMLLYDGTVDYYLDPDDYSKKADGTASDVADVSYQGNAMMEWGQGGKKIWYKIVPDAGDNTSASVYIANFQADSGYHAWSFINNQGELVDHFYTPIYNGSIDGDGRLRSISGMASTALCQSKTVPEEIAAAELNNPSTDKLWYTEVYADITLINLLLILMGKSLNTQAVFGMGRTDQAANTDTIGTGTMDTRGLFWGSSGSNDGVKVFGMENWWGNQWRRYAGHITVDRIHKIKLTRGRQDGSAADDYNATAAGYIDGAEAPQANGYITKMQFDGNGFQSKEVGGNSAHDWCDYTFQAGGTRYAFRGGSCTYIAQCGAFFVAANSLSSVAGVHVGAALSCKPLKGV